MSPPDGPRRARFQAALHRLRDDVRRGPYAARDMLPGERDLAGRLSVSRTTVRRILATLIEEGLLTHRQGVGTFVAPALPTEAPAALLAGFTAAVRRRGHQATSRDIKSVVLLPTPHEAMMLAAPPDESVARITRVRCIDGEGVAIERAVLPRWALPPAAAVDGSLYEILGARGVIPVRAQQRLRIGIATADEARQLGVDAPAAVARLQRTDVLADGRCCLYARTIVRADRFDLVLDGRSGDLLAGIVTFED